MRYKFDILRNNVKVGELNGVESCSVHFDADANIKRSASLTCSASSFSMSKVRNKTSGIRITFQITAQFKTSYKDDYLVFNPFTDRIVPYYGDMALGVFMICSSPVSIDGKDKTYNFEMYDESFKLDQSKTSERYFIPEGTKYTSAIEQILTSTGIIKTDIEDSDYTTNIDKEFEIGTSKLDIINSLLKEINYETIWFNSEGYAVASKQQTKTEPDFIYREGNYSTIYEKIGKTMDIYNVPNVFVGVVSTPDVSPLIYRTENDSPNSQLSTFSRGYEVTSVYTLNDIASYDELVAYIDKKKLEAMQVEEDVDITTAIEKHEYKESIQLEAAGIVGLYVEKRWDVDMFNHSMKHSIERSVLL